MQHVQAGRLERRRRLLLASAAVCALGLSASQAYSGCVSTGTSVITLECTGLVTGPLNVPAGTDILNINNVSSDITAGSNQDGVSFSRSSGAVVISADLSKTPAGSGNYAISAGRGIHARTDDAAGADTSVIIVGDITSTHASYGGIYARSTRDVKVGFTGTLNGNAGGIDARSFSKSGTADIDTAGSITTSNTAINVSIYAQETGSITVDNSGKINATTGRGINTWVTYSGAGGKGTGSTKVYNDGKITSAFSGIFVTHSASGAILVDNDGNINTTSVEGNFGIGPPPPTYAIIANSSGNRDTGAVTFGGTVKVDNSANLTAAIRGGISASGAGNVEVINSGTIDAKGQPGGSAIGIAAASSGTDTSIKVTVTNSGTINTRTYGIIASADSGNVEIKNYANVTASAGGGIRGSASNGTVRIESTGTVAATTDDGISGSSTAKFADVYIKSNGDVSTAVSNPPEAAITAGATGKSVAGDVNASVTIKSTGNITSTNSRGISTAVGYSDPGGNGLGATKIYSDGDINSSFAGIRATHHASGSILIDSKGDIRTTGNEGSFIGPGPSASAINVRSYGDRISGTVSLGGAVTVKSDGDLYSRQFSGIEAGGAGLVDVESTGKIEAKGGWGIIAGSSGASTAATVTVTNKGVIEGKSGGISAGSVNGGIDVDNDGNITSSHGPGISTSSTAGNISISNTGVISAGGGIGIRADTDAGDITIHTYNNVTSTDTAISADASPNSGGIVVKSITAIAAGVANIKSTAGSGITTNAREEATAITNVGNIEALGTGIWSRAYDGAASVTVNTTGDITTTNGANIDIFSRGTGRILVTSDGNLYSKNSAGIFVRGDKSYSGSISVDARNTVTGSGTISAKNSAGIYADTSGSAATATVEIRNLLVIESGSHGILARSSGGDVTVDNYANVSSSAGSGILASSSDGNISVDNTGVISAVKGFGILASSQSGDVSVTNTKNITSQDSSITADASPGAGAVTVSSIAAIAAGVANIKSTAGSGIATNAREEATVITNVGNIEALDTGIWSRAYDGAASVTVNTTGDITTTNGANIDIFSRGTGRILVTSDGNLYSKNSAGIFVRGDKSYNGSISVDARNTVTGSGTISAKNSVGIYADTFGSAATATVEVKNLLVIEAGSHGILARSSGGDVTVDNYANVSSSAGTGILASSSDGNISVDNTGVISAVKGFGIRALSSSGNISVTNTKNITSQNNAITADASPGAGAVTVSNITTRTAGVNNIYSTAGGGIFTNARQKATSVTNVANIKAVSGGISSKAYDGAADIAIDHTGTISTVNGAAIGAFSASGGVTVSSVGDLSSTNGDGISAKGYGSVSVTATGEAVGAGVTTGKIDAGGYGIFAYNGLTDIAATVSITNSQVIKSVSSGIRANSRGGAVTIDNNAAITSSGGNGIFSSAAQGDVSIDNAGVIQAQDGDGIIVLTNGNLTIINTEKITAKFRGIYAASDGELKLNSHGEIKTTGGNGITVSTRANLATVNVTEKIESYGTGIYARSYGAASGSAGQLAIKTTASVASIDSTGIDAFSSYGTSIKIEASGGTISSERSGGIIAYVAFSTLDPGKLEITGDAYITSHLNAITALNGTGAVTLDVTGRIKSTEGMGIYARSFFVASYVTDLMKIEAGDSITSKGDGVNASAGGALSIDVTGAINSSDGRGIHAQSSSLGSGLVTVNSGVSVKSRLEGISGRTGTGGLTIDARGDVTSSENSGIVAEGKSNLLVTVKGLTTGASGFAGVEFGDAAAGNDGVNNSLDIASTGSVTNAGNTATVLSKLAILGRTGSEAVSNSGTVTGSVDLGGGTDSFVNEKSGTFVAGNTVSLGAGETVTNHGKLSVGHTSNMLTTNLTGNVGQTADGVFMVDFMPHSVAVNRASDVLVLTGDASLSGTVRATQWSGTTVDVAQDFVIMRTTGGTINKSGLTLDLRNGSYAGFTASLVLTNFASMSGSSSASSIAPSSGFDTLVLRFTAGGPPPATGMAEMAAFRTSELLMAGPAPGTRRT